MNTYSITQVETLTKISAHKLRVWERRYDFVKPLRTESNIRYFSDSQLKNLLNVGILNRNGIKVSKINQMTIEEVNQKVHKIISSINPKIQDEIDALIIAMIEFDEKGFNLLFQKCYSRIGFLKSLLDVVYPFLKQVGLLWTTNQVNISQEHFMSNLIRQKMISEIDKLPLPNKNAPMIALFLLENDHHEIGLLLSNYIAKNAGWKVIYLGQGYPIEQLQQFVDQAKPDIIQTFTVTPKSSEEQKNTARFLKVTPPSQLIIAGNNLELLKLVNFHEIIHIKTPNDLISFLEQNFASYQQ